MRIFKRVSTNSKDLDFKQFLECIEAIAVIYFKDNNEDIHKLLRMYATNKVNNHFKITKKLETTDEIYDEFSISVQKG